jgi:peptidoglycan hydrolase CwlO-like protein
VAELEENNAKLLAELEQTRQALVEADSTQNSLSESHTK